MSDFAQNGVVCTLQRLNDFHLEDLSKKWLPELAHSAPVTLILPCHHRDLGQPALRHICAELNEASWLKQIIIPVNGVPETDIPDLKASFRAALSLPATVIDTNNHGLRRAMADAAGRPGTSLAAGKGLNVWAAIGFLHAQGTTGKIALQDADVLSFRQSSLARLCFAVSDPALGFDFAKMYYSRVTDRLYGRVSRLFVAPLLQSLIHVAGHHPLLDFLQCFRYPLAGECAMGASLAANLSIGEGWRLEVGMLSDVFRRLDPRRVCQVDGGSGYDHKHQAEEQALLPMCAQIGQTLLQQLAIEGCQIDAAFLKTLHGRMLRESTEAVSRSAALAKINGIPCDQPAESATALAFAKTLPHEITTPPPLLPAWSSIERINPGAFKAFAEAISTTAY